MKMNIAIVITSTLLISSSVQAAGWNVNIFGGEQNNADFDKSYGVGISKRVTPRAGVGFEVGYTKNQSINSTTGRSLMLTGEYDFIRYGRFSTYGGAGFGAMKVKNQTHSDTVAGGRLSLGARFSVTPRTKLFLEARRIDAFKDPRIANNNGRFNYEGDSYLLGIRYRF